LHDALPISACCRPTACRMVMFTTNRENASLALGVLWRLAGSPKADLLALLHAGVTREQPGAFQHRAELVIETQKRPRDPVPHGTGLAGYTAARHRRDYVELLCRPGHAHWRQYRLLMHRATPEILVAGFAIDHDLAVSRIQTDAGDGCLATTDPVIILATPGLSLFSHRSSLTA